MKITLILTFPGHASGRVLVAIGALHRALPTSAKLTPLFAFDGDALDDHVATETTLTPLELVYPKEFNVNYTEMLSTLSKSLNDDSLLQRH